MTTPEELLSGMEQILGDLLENARKMLQKSQQTFSPSELMSLQALQDQLMDRLVASDTALREAFPEVMEEGTLPAVERIEQGLAEFQVLNKEFVDNVMRQKPVIQFEREKAAKAKHRAPSVKEVRSAHPAGGNTTVHSKKKQ